MVGGEFHLLAPYSVIVYLAAVCENRREMCHSQRCPDDVEDQAVRYLGKRMLDKEAAAFESHVAECAQCREVVSATEVLIQALRDATSEST